MHKSCVALTIACLALAGCGKKDKDEAGNKAKPGDTTAEPGKVPAKPGPAATTPPVAKPEPAKPAEPPTPKWLSPEDLDPSRPIPVDALGVAINKWKKGTKVIIAGYAKFFLGEEGTLTRSVDLVNEPGKKGGHDKLVQCEFDPKISQKVTNQSPLVLEATIDKSWGRDKTKRYIWMKKCSLVSHDKPFDANAPAVPGSAKPIPVAAFSKDFYGFEGKEVAVVGKYWGQTTSSYKGKTSSIRIDIVGKNGKKAAGCFLDANISKTQQDAVNAKREGIVFKGKIGESRFGVPSIESCVIANR